MCHHCYRKKSYVFNLHILVNISVTETVFSSNESRARIENTLENLRNILGRGVLPRSHFFLQSGMYTCSARVSLQSADDTT